MLGCVETDENENLDSNTFENKDKIHRNNSDEILSDREDAGGAPLNINGR